MRKWLTEKLRPDSKSSHEGVHGQSNQSKTLINAVYYPNWKVYNGTPPSSLATDYISHVFYAFAWPTEAGAVALSDNYADTKIEIDGVYGCLAALRELRNRQPHLKIILSLGGGGRQGSSHFAGVASSPELRARFSQAVRHMVDEHGFDGVDVDWEHPQNRAEGSNYTALLAELRRVLPTQKYLLTTALPAGEWALQNINLSSASSFLDFINVMAYDFAGPWVPETGHHAQLFSPKCPHNDAAAISGDSAVRYFLSKGVPAHKLVLGIPAYGRSFLGANGIGSSYSGHAGDEGTFEYRDLPRTGATEHVDQSTVAAFCVGGDGGFVTYDTVETVREKAKYARQHQLGGLFYWTGPGDTLGPRSLVLAGYTALHSL